MNSGQKIGIFLCDCGGTLSKVADFSQMKSRLEKLPDVAFVGISHDLCHETGRKVMQSDIKENDIERVVVAACSPVQIEDSLKQTVRAAGVNPHLLTIANIREQGFWAHGSKAAPKVLVQIVRAVNRGRLQEAIEQIEVPVSRDVLVIGGGIAGMQTAIELSKLGLKATLLEEKPTLGGRSSGLASMYPLPGLPEEMLIEKLAQIADSGKINVMTSAHLMDVSGEAGNFSARIKGKGGEFVREFGAIAIATGNAIQPGQEPSKSAVSHTQLEQMLKFPGKVDAIPKTVCFVTDVADEHSRAATASTLRNALGVREKFGSEVYVVCKQLKVDGAGLERLYHNCRDNGVLFIKSDAAPKISRHNGKMQVETVDTLLTGQQVSIIPDLLVVDEKVTPPDEAKTLSAVLSLGLDKKGFYQEANVHLYPVASNREGIFFAGTCHADLDLTRIMAEASNAAFNAWQLLGQKVVVVDKEKVFINPDKCRFCLTCIRACPHHAIQESSNGNEKKVAQIIDLACQECGVCTVVCPARAISAKDWSDEQIFAELEPLGDYV